MPTVKIGNFLVVESEKRLRLDSTYRHIGFLGKTCDLNGLLEMANGMQRTGVADIDSSLSQITDVKDAVARIERGGWIVLEFLN